MNNKEEIAMQHEGMAIKLSERQKACWFTFWKTAQPQVSMMWGNPHLQTLEMVMKKTFSEGFIVGVESMLEVMEEVRNDGVADS